MLYRRILVPLTVLAIGAAVVLYTGHPAKSSDHQDTYNLATRANTSADITDVFIFPSPSNPNNVVLAMDVSPLIPKGMGSSFFFDPSVMWQFKIAHGSTSPEDQVIQFGVTGTGASQIITMYGPGAPHEVGTANTFIAPAGSFQYNVATQLSNGAKVFAGPRADPFYFDLFAFFSFLGDRNWATHSSQTDPGPETGGPLYNGDSVGAPGAFAPAYDKSANPAQHDGRRGLRTRQLRLQHQPGNEHAGADRRRLQRPLVRRRDSEDDADQRLYQFEHPRVGDG